MLRATFVWRMRAEEDDGWLPAWLGMLVSRYLPLHPCRIDIPKTR